MSVGQAIQEEIDFCRRCGRQWHVSQLQMQEGVLRCTISCLDDLSNKYRQLGIQKVLSDGSNESSSDKPKMFEDPGEVVFR
jgi:hypothetical protein